MVKYEINLHNVEDVKKFVEIVRKYDFNVDIMSQQYIVDAKSMLGILSLDLGMPVEVYTHSDDCDELLQKLVVFACEDSMPEVIEQK